MTLEQLNRVLLVGALVLLASIVATRLATRVGLPSLLLFLGLGVLVGEDGIGLRFDDVALVRDLGTAALAIILIEGGLTTKFSDVRKSLDEIRDAANTASLTWVANLMPNNNIVYAFCDGDDVVGTLHLALRALQAAQYAHQHRA